MVISSYMPLMRCGTPSEPGTALSGGRVVPMPLIDEAAVTDDDEAIAGGGSGAARHFLEHGRVEADVLGCRHLPVVAGEHAQAFWISRGVPSRTGCRQSRWR